MNGSSLIQELNIRIVKVINPLLLAIPFAAFWSLSYEEFSVFTFFTRRLLFVLFMFIILYVTFGRLYDAFLISLMRISEVIYSQTIAVFMADGLMFIVGYLIYEQILNMFLFLMCIIAQEILVILWAYLSHCWYFKKHPPQKTAIIWDAREDMEKLVHRYGMTIKFDIIANVSIKECLDNEMKVLDNVESVFLCGIHSHERNQILKYCLSKGVIVYVIPRIGDTLMSSAMPLHLFRLPMMRLNRYVPTPEYLLLKRFFDIIISCIGFVLLLPISLAVIMAIKLEDNGTVFYKQLRLTQDRRNFWIIKFRSMKENAEKDTGAVLSAGRSDERVTKVGRVLRRYRLDEIPQLINVIKGDMSLVGPRPERPELTEKIEKDMPEFALRMQVKAGITGYAQVFGAYDSSAYDKLLMDLTYIAKPSLSLDVMILLATVKALFLPQMSD